MESKSTNIPCDIKKLNYRTLNVPNMQKPDISVLKFIKDNNENIKLKYITFQRPVDKIVLTKTNHLSKELIVCF